MNTLTAFLLGTLSTLSPDRSLHGPHTHAQLTLFVIEGPDRLALKDTIGLDAALQAKTAVVHETGQVSQLRIQNKGKVPVFAQAGDIVRGGRQDRVLSKDVLIPPGQTVPISSFCVEQGRWSQRGGEAAHRFNSAKKHLPNKALKMAARRAKDQRAVWQAVQSTQDKLSAQTKARVQDRRSPSSLQLSLENPQVAEVVKVFISKLKSAPDGVKNPVGFAFAINGELSTAEIFAASDLFRQQWPKLLEAAAVEAVLAGYKSHTAPGAEQAETFLKKDRTAGQDAFRNAPEDSNAWVHTSLY